MNIKKSGMVSIIGKPNVGKSTLANCLVGEKIAIVSNKPQTTRNRICAVCNSGDTQIVFVDTPGFHKPHSKLDEYMVNVVNTSVSSVDAIVLMIEPVAELTTVNEMLIEKIDKSGLPSVLVINKIDTIKKEKLLQIIDIYSNAYKFDAIVPMSAKTGEGRENLLNELKSFIKEGPELFPEGMVTDQPERQIMAEIIREKILNELDREVPHGIAVEIERFIENEKEIIEIDATIYCEKASHKGIVIGKRGAMLKKIGEQARVDMEAFMGTKVFLQTWVKVKDKWRNSEAMIKNFGYRD